MAVRLPKAFVAAMELLAVHEGGYVNHPADPGGATNRGVTQRVYDAWRVRRGQKKQSVALITTGEAQVIYHAQYWRTVSADELPTGIDYCVFDAAVNSGPSRAAKWAQQVCGRLGHTVAVDGVIGEVTLEAIEKCSPVAFVHAYCDTRLAFMRRLRHYPTFKRGWERRVKEVRETSLSWIASGAVTRPAPGEVRAPLPRATGPMSLKYLPGLIAIAIIGAFAFIRRAFFPSKEKDV